MATYNCLTAADYRYQASQVANEIEGKMARWSHWAAQLSAITADDFTALGLSADEQAQMGSMRTTVAALVAAYEADGNKVFIKRHAQLMLQTH